MKEDHQQAIEEKDAVNVFMSFVLGIASTKRRI